jgi:hypothetical protein
MKTQRTVLALALTALPFAACDCSPPDVPDVDIGQGDGVVVTDGEEEQYAVNPDESELIIVVENFADQFGCGLFHSHVVESTGFVSSFRIDRADAAGSTFSAVVPAIGLQPDSDELRTRFLPNDPLLNDGDRSSIKVSVLENLQASDHPVLTFEASDLSTLDGEGTATVDVDIAGETSQIEMTYTVTEADGVFTIEGEGEIDGAPHGIPNGFASDCVSGLMDLHLKLVLEPGASDNQGIGDAGVPEFVPTEFPYEGDCAPDVAFDEVMQILGPRCVGCHMEPTRLGASIPLTEYDHFRVDTARTEGTPVYETIGEYIQLPATESLHMPPLELSQLSTEELNTLVAWVEADAPDVRCDPDPPAPFVHVEPAECGTVIFDDVDDEFIGAFCSECHSATQTALPILDTYESGLVTSEHPFYQPLNMWESSLVRLRDGSMPPQFGADFADDELAADFVEWVTQGYPSVRCDAPDAGPDAGADAGDAG